MAEREFPHRVGTAYQVNLPPCSQWPVDENDHCGQSNPEAIDMDYPIGTDVLAAAPGIVDKRGFRSDVGNYVVLREVHPREPATSSAYITYQHLNSITVNTGDYVAPGRKIAESGCTGSTCEGRHLHFHRASASPTWIKEVDRPKALPILPIDGYATLIDDDVPADDQGPSYLSTNAAVGWDVSGADNLAFPTTYRDFDMRLLGRPHILPWSWSPCEPYIAATQIREDHWRYRCQTYYNGVTGVRMPYNGQFQLFITRLGWYRALAQMDGSPNVYYIPDAILYGYTTWQYCVQSGCHDWVNTMGFPVGDPVRVTHPLYDHFYQNFQNGQIRYWWQQCRVEVHSTQQKSPTSIEPYEHFEAGFDYCTTDPHPAYLQPS